MLEPSSSSAPTPKRRRLRFALSRPSHRDGFIVFWIGKLAAWLTRTAQATEFCHCEMLFEDDRCFGITSQGMHFAKRRLMLDEYEFYGIMVDETVYQKLLENCQTAIDEQKFAFSSTKAICRHLFWARYLTRLWSMESTYCSELLVQVMHAVGIFTDLSLDDATPNGLATHIVGLMNNYDAFVCCGPDLLVAQSSNNV